MPAPINMPLVAELFVACGLAITNVNRPISIDEAKNKCLELLQGVQGNKPEYMVMNSGEIGNFFDSIAKWYLEERGYTVVFE